MIDFNKPEFVDVGEVTLPVYRGGPNPTDTGKPPLVFLHGWPDLAFSWRHQMNALAAEGYPVFAPDQRGYGRASKPDGVENYTARKLAGDLAGLLDHYGLKDAVFIGHDWGAIILWQLPHYMPDRVRGYAGLAVPLMRHFPVDPISIFRARLGDDMYIVRFQTEGACEPILEADLEATFKFFHRRPTVGKSPAEDFSFSTKNLDLISLLQAGEEAWGGEALLSNAELQYFVEAYTEGGFTGPLHWYRNMTANWEAQKKFLVDGELPNLRKPCLMITAELDRACPPSLADGMEDLCEPFERIDMKGCGHWLMGEKTDEVNGALLNWLGRHF